MLAPAEAFAKEQRRHQQHDARVEIEDQPFKGSGDVLQAEKIERARGIVAEQPDDDQPQMIARRKRRSPSAAPQVRQTKNGPENAIRRAISVAASTP